MSDFEVGLHARADRSLTITTVLLMWPIITLPIALYAFFRIARMRVKISASGFEERGLLVTDRVNFDEVERFGLFYGSPAAAGKGAYLASMMVNHGDVEIYLVFLLKNGKTVKFLANQYEDHFGMIERLAAGARVPREELQAGLFRLEWPQKQL